MYVYIFISLYVYIKSICEYVNESLYIHIYIHMWVNEIILMK